MHHIDFWTSDLDACTPSFDWLLTALGWVRRDDPAWPAGLTWHHASGAYVVLEQSPAVAGPHDRMRAGLNHLALRAADREQLDGLRSAADHGWVELFADRYPHAGGPDHTALFLENVEGFEFEIVVG